MRIEAAKLERVVVRVLTAARCTVQEASCVARHLVEANLRGHDSHGVLRVPRYVGFIERGEVRPGVVPQVVLDAPAFLVLDGGMGFGQVVGEHAMRALARKARESGIALAGVRNSGHLGRIGGWAEMLAAEGLVSLHFVNTTGKGMRAVPFGGSDARLSINPLAIAVPLPDRPPLVLDMTTTVVAEGKLAVARNRGEPVPPGTIVDKHGRPSTDPNDFYDGGALLPIAGHKGSGLNIMTDILAGALSGGGCTRPGVTVLANTMTSIAIDPGRVAEPATFAAEVLRYAAHVRGSPPLEPGGEVLLPGEIEERVRAERRAEGVPLDQATWGQIVEAAESVGLKGVEIEALARDA